MSNYAASIVSLFYNAKAAKSGNILRHISTVGHAVKVATKFSKTDTDGGRALKDVFDSLNKSAKTNKGLDLLGKGLRLTKKTDPISLTCLSIRTAKSNSPVRTLMAGAADYFFSTVVEDFMVNNAKSIANVKGIKTLNDKLVNFSKSSGMGQIPSLIYGGLFAAGSILSGNLAAKAGNWLADKLGLSQEEKSNPNIGPDGKKKYYFG